MKRPANQPHSAIKIKSIDEYISKDESLVWAFSRVMAAIALDNKGASPAELDILMEFARQSISPVLVGVLIFSTIEAEPTLASTLKELKRRSTDLLPEQRDAAFRSALPLIELQGSRANDLKERLASALGDPELAHRRSESVNWGILDGISDDMSRIFRARDFADEVLYAAEAMGDLYLVESYRRYRKNGDVDLTEAVNKVSACLDTVAAYLEEKRLEPLEAENFRLHSTKFIEQINQRINLLLKRLSTSKTHLIAEVEEIIKDVGDAAETGMQDRLMTDDWKKSQVWESIGRTQFGLLAERKINRVINRLNDDIRLYEEELRIFQSEATIAVAAIIRNEHYSRFDGLEKPLRILTIVEETAHDIAEKTLWVSALGLAGVGAAAVALGPVTVISALTALAGPTAIKVGAFIVGTGLFKWFSSPESRRKYAEIKSKRGRVEELVRDRLAIACDEYEKQLDLILETFTSTAIEVTTPVSLEVEALKRLPILKRRVLEKSIARSRDSLERLTSRSK